MQCALAWKIRCGELYTFEAHIALMDAGQPSPPSARGTLLPVAMRGDEGRHAVYILADGAGAVWLAAHHPVAGSVPAIRRPNHE